ncbi:MAG: asparagine synthase (glutamine-hydrolyzing) [Phototrophicaceae bacterium]
MCGISGEFRYAARPTIANWEAIVDLAIRRGPDDKGLWNENSHCTLGFRRLAILDLSPTGRQPMHTPDGRYVLVYNGELYNFQTLRRELEQQGIRFRSTGDTEIVLYALAMWGTNALNRFNGMFALAFYDTQEKTLLLARDHAGIKPLYYLNHADGVMFASQYNQLLAHPWSDNLEVSPEALAKYFAHYYIPAPLALYQKTHMLEAGTWLQIRQDGTQQKERYYEFVNQPAAIFGGEAIEAVDAAITDAVKRQMISDVPLGTFLSGGIDSPVVTAKAREISNHDIFSYSIGVPGFAGDESQDAKRYADEIGVIQKIRNFDSNIAYQQLQTVMSATTAPFADYSLFPTMMVAEEARKDVTVILSGDGGDEMFWGYTRSFNILRYTQLYNLPHFSRKILAKLASRVGGHYFASVAGIEDMRAFFAKSHNSFPISWFDRIMPEISQHRTPPINSNPISLGRNDVANWLRKAEFEHYLPEVLMKVDRGSMYHSLEVRVPLLDRAVLDVAQYVDWKTCVDLDLYQGKLPLRKILAKHVKHQTTKKLGFTVPMEDWLRTSLKDVFEETVLTRDSIMGIPINNIQLRAFFQAHLDKTYNAPGPLWSLLSLALWEDENIKNHVGIKV